MVRVLVDDRRAQPGADRVTVFDRELFSTGFDAVGVDDIPSVFRRILWNGSVRSPRRLRASWSPQSAVDDFPSLTHEK